MGTDNPLFLARFTKIVWRSQTRIEHPVPRLGQSVEDRKVQGFKRSVDHNIEILVAQTSAPQVIGKTMRVKTKIGGGADPTPADIVAPEPTSADARVRLTEGDHSLTEAKEICVSLQPTPIQPGRWIILVIGIIISMLRVQKLISG